MNKFFSFSFSLLGSSSFALASIPFGIGSATAQEAKTTQGTAADLGVMSISLKDAIQPNFGFQGALQGDGTPNQAGIGGFLPLTIGDNSVFFLDAQANVNFADFNEYSSIINTKVAGTTISTSSRLGYRWLNKNRSWMYGINAGYDSRPLNTGGTDNGVYVTDSKSVFFQQLALNLEAVSNKWFTSAYLLYPIGEYGYNKSTAIINNVYAADSVMTAGTDIGYNFTPRLKASVGYYYSEGDAGAANGNSVRGRLEYNMANGLTSGINIAYDPAYSEGYSSGDFYKTLRLSVDFKYRFGANGYGAPSIRKQQPVVMPVIQALSTTPANRVVRVHDRGGAVVLGKYKNTTVGAAPETPDWLLKVKDALSYLPRALGIPLSRNDVDGYQKLQEWRKRECAARGKHQVAMWQSEWENLRRAYDQREVTQPGQVFKDPKKGLFYGMCG